MALTDDGPSERRRLWSLSRPIAMPIGLLLALALGGGPLIAWTWDLPPGTPPPRVPADNPMSVEKVELGRRLFFDRRLSGDGTMHCATCHRSELAFTDGLARPVGITGERHPRGAMTLINVAYGVSFGWDDPRVHRLEEQLTTPLFGHEPVEMGARPSQVIERLRADPEMVRRFAEVFGDRPMIDGDGIGGALIDGPLSDAARVVTVENLAKAIAAFERTLIVANAPFDRYWRGDDAALSSIARRGMRLFFSQRVGCSGCHRGFNLSGPVVHSDSDEDPDAGSRTAGFRDNGLLPDAPGPEVPRTQRGLARITGEASDIGRFKVPTLRNIVQTAPYMHDGALATLDAVLDHYASGGLDTNEIEPFTLTVAERAELLAFLDALTDTTSLRIEPGEIE